LFSFLSVNIELQYVTSINVASNGFTDCLLVGTASVSSNICSCIVY